MELFSNFSKVKILVAGDLMLDQYWWGTVDRISPEAPVPIVELNRTSTVLGGAANVAANVAALGAGVSLVGTIGEDGPGADFRELLNKSGILSTSVVSCEDRPTSVKTRIVAHSQQVVRVDHESNRAIDSSVEEQVLEKLPSLVETVDVILISDYAKGFLTDRLTKELIRLARRAHKTVLVDPKGKNYIKYAGASILTPNSKETAEATRTEINSIDSLHCAARSLIDELSLNAVIVTRGEEGMTLFAEKDEPFHVNSRGREVYDVTGAGDTVIATLAVCLASGIGLRDAVTAANTAAGIVVSEIGTTVITKDKLVIELSGSPSIESHSAISY